jgi:hypothetical protein
MLNVLVPNIIKMSLVMLSIIMLNIVMLSVSILGVIIISDTAPIFNFLQKPHKRLKATKKQM